MRKENSTPCQPQQDSRKPDTTFPLAESDGLHVVTTADGKHVKMRRYRPAPGAPFRSDGRPVLLLNAILTNMNEYAPCTPPEKKKAYRKMRLPVHAAPWAKDDIYIQDDPLRYYSLAHYLWLQGYDPWLANYRDTGRDAFKSERGGNLTTLDIWALLDASACIEKVIELTGKDIIIGGHSTGGFVSYAYLQGAYLDIDELKAGYQEGYIPHVKSDAALAEERHKRILGFIAIDPGTVVNVPAWLNNKIWRRIYGLPVFLNVELFWTRAAYALFPAKLLRTGLALAFELINFLTREFGRNPLVKHFISYLDFCSMANTNPYMVDYMSRYMMEGATFRCGSHWVDIGLCGGVREHWKNGRENKRALGGNTAAPGQDGYYYYDQNMHRVCVPTIAILSELNGLVIADHVVKVLMQGKTPHKDDIYFEIPGSGHAELPFGLSAPTMIYPRIGAWLKEITAQAVLAGSKFTTKTTNAAAFKTDPAPGESNPVSNKGDASA